MKSKIAILIITISTLWSPATKGQSLDDLIKIAFENNLELKVLENEYLAALERAPQLSQRPDPEVSVGAFPFPVETRLGGQIARLSATQMFLWPGDLDSKKDLALAKAKTLYERTAARKLELNFEIKQAYYKLYEIQQSHSIIQQNTKLLEALERLALTKVESGKTTAADVLRVQLKITELETELEILEKAKTSPIVTINQLLHRPLETTVLINDSLSFAQIEYHKDSLLANIKTNHPSLRMFELQQDVFRQAMVVNNLSGKPSFGLGMDYIMVNKRTDAEPAHNGRDILQLRASVKLPLNKRKYEAKEKEEKLKIIALDHKKEDALSRFSAAIEKAFADYEIAQLKIGLYDQQLEITRSAIRMLETAYSTQASQFDELLRLEKELIDYDLKMLKAIVQSHLAKSNIDRFNFDL